MEKIKTKIYIEQNARGPNKFSNWVIFPNIIEKGRILMSSYPYRIHLSKNEQKKYPRKTDFYKQVKSFPSGVTYICLQEKSELAQLQLPIYYSKKQLEKVQKITQVKYIKYNNDLEIRDIDINTDDLVFSFTEKLLDSFMKGENFVIHCLGGHGRTGTIAGLLMGMILAKKGICLRATELLDLIGHCHLQRVQLNGWFHCPQTKDQCLQVQRLYYKYLTLLGLTLHRENLL